MTCPLNIIGLHADIQEALLPEVHLDRLVMVLVKIDQLFIFNLVPLLSSELTDEELKQEEKEEKAKERSA